MFRRSIGWILSVAFGMAVMHTLDWHPGLKAELLSFGLPGLGVLVLGVAALAVLGWAMAKPSRSKVILAFVLGIGAAMWASSMFRNSVGTSVILIVVGLAALALLWALTIVQSREELFNLHKARSGEPDQQQDGNKSGGLKALFRAPVDIILAGRAVYYDLRHNSGKGTTTADRQQGSSGNEADAKTVTDLPPVPQPQQRPLRSVARP